MPNNNSSLRNFREAISISSKLLSNVGPRLFFSPYSVVPAISQILGLNTPLMGTGDSPYSLTSIAFNLKEKKVLFGQAFKIPLLEKRCIIDEIYEMIAPCLLEEEGAYIDLVCKTKGGSKPDIQQKFALLRPFINKFLNKSGQFAHIVHYGYLDDLYREYNFLERLPPRLSGEWRDCSFPIVNELLIRNFSGPQGKKDVCGWVIFVTNFTKELLESNKLRKRKILQAARLAEKLGAKLVGMGGLVASFAQGGNWLSQQIPSIGFTTGHAYTIGNIMNILQESAKRKGIDIQKTTVAVIGAAGSIGSGCAKLLAEKNPKQIILVELSSFDSVKKLEGLKQDISKLNPKISVKFSFKIADVKQAGVIIVATNSPTSLLKSEHIKHGAIIIDDSFPKNVPKSILQKRKDILLLEGGITQLPYQIDVYSARNMPDLMDLPLTRAISCKEVYGCFAETLTLALHNHKGNYGLGSANTKLSKDILAKAKKYHFGLAPLQCFDEAVEEERLK